MAIRLDDEPIAHPTNQPSFAEEVANAKANKQVLLEGAFLFNQKPKIGLAYLEEHQVIYGDPSVPREESLARFFKTCPKLDKKLLGDFISRPDQLEVLRAFMRLMEFEGVRPVWRVAPCQGYWLTFLHCMFLRK
jgi:brefeldin A-resistance guanine nucleotide exchange factor 1